jgi:hypothetical protein
MATATDPGTRTMLQRAALFAARAPSIHNSQPWRWCVTDQALGLFLARSRILRSTDPHARLATLSCGAALHHARVYLAANGRRAVVCRLPARTDPDHLARVSIDRRIPVDPGAVRLEAAARIRQTDRRTRPAVPLDIDTLRTIGLAVRQEGCLLTRITGRQVYELAAAVDLARRTVAADAGKQSEVTEWVGGDQPFGTGVPASAMAENRARAGADEHDLGRPGSDLIADTHHRAAAFAILHGSGNDSRDWLGAGEALSAAWLTATQIGVSVLPLSAVIEVAAGRPAIRRLIGGAGYPYLVLRFAAVEPGKPRPPFTPRLPAATTVEGLDQTDP